MAEYTAADERLEEIVDVQKKVEKLRLAYVRGVNLSGTDILLVLESLTRIVSAHEKMLERKDA